MPTNFCGQFCFVLLFKKNACRCFGFTFGFAFSCMFNAIKTIECSFVIRIRKGVRRLISKTEKALSVIAFLTEIYARKNVDDLVIAVLLFESFLWSMLECCELKI